MACTKAFDIDLAGFLAAPRAPMPDLLSTATALHALSILGVDVAPVAVDHQGHHAAVLFAAAELVAPVAWGESRNPASGWWKGPSAVSRRCRLRWKRSPSPWLLKLAKRLLLMTPTVCALRQKLNTFAEVIETVRGVGYRFRDPRVA